MLNAPLAQTDAETARPRTSPGISLADVARVFDERGNKRMRIYEVAEVLDPEGSERAKQEVRAQIRRVIRAQSSAFDRNGVGIRLRSAKT
jgi:hypothetical protein